MIDVGLCDECDSSLYRFVDLDTWNHLLVVLPGRFQR
jgi:hypothetical protein